MKKVLSVLLIACVLAAALAGCKSGSGKENRAAKFWDTVTLENGEVRDPKAAFLSDRTAFEALYPAAECTGSLPDIGCYFYQEKVDFSDLDSDKTATATFKFYEDHLCDITYQVNFASELSKEQLAQFRQKVADLMKTDAPEIYAKNSTDGKLTADTFTWSGTETALEVLFYTNRCIIHLYNYKTGNYMKNYLDYIAAQSIASQKAAASK